MRLVFVTQRVDVDDPVLGATVAKLRALSSRCEEVHVLALAAGAHDLPANVRVSTFGARTRLGRGLRFARLLVPALVRRPSALIAHMAPIYAILAAPLARPLRVPLLLWYTHWASTRSLRVAAWLCDRVLSVDRTSFPLDSPKVLAIGHGIDVAEFSVPGRPEPRPGLSLVALGRTSPTKGLEIVLDAFELALARGLEADLEIRGASSTEAERGYRRRLEERISRKALDGRVRIEPAVARSQVPALLVRFDALVNAHAGTLDKVVYEAAALGVPTLACSPGFGELLDGLPVDLRFRSGDAEDLAARLLDFAASTEDDRLEAGRELRERVKQRHSSETWAAAVVRLVTDLSGGTGR